MVAHNWESLPSWATAHYFVFVKNNFGLFNIIEDSLVNLFIAQINNNNPSILLSRLIPKTILFVQLESKLNTELGLHTHHHKLFSQKELWYNFEILHRVNTHKKI